MMKDQTIVVEGFRGEQLNLTSPVLEPWGYRPSESQAADRAGDDPKKHATSIPATQSPYAWTPPILPDRIASLTIHHVEAFGRGPDARTA